MKQDGGWENLKEKLDYFLPISWRRRAAAGLQLRLLKPVRPKLILVSFYRIDLVKLTNVDNAVALFDYKACYEDELGFKKGDAMTVTEEVVGQKGWFKGFLATDTARIGLIPGNYIQEETVRYSY
jgi:hypothetical protein